MRKALYILGSLDDVDIEWIARQASRVALPARETLIKQGESIDCLYILIEGQLSVRIGRQAEHEIATLLPGEIVGEISFVDNRKPTASVFALQDSWLLALNKSALAQKLGRDPNFASRFYRAIAVFLADRLYATTSRLGYGSSDQDNHQDADEMNDSMMDDVSLASLRFDKLLRYLAGGQDMGSFAGVTS